jgi:hypothetical protein
MTWLIFVSQKRDGLPDLSSGFHRPLSTSIQANPAALKNELIVAADFFLRS